VLTSGSWAKTYSVRLLVVPAPQSKMASRRVSDVTPAPTMVHATWRLAHLAARQAARGTRGHPDLPYTSLVEFRAEKRAHPPS